MEPIKVLLVEDNLADIELTEMALKSGKILNEVYTVTDGEAALEFLNKQGDYVDSPTPDMILLDLNLPKLDGREILAEIKSTDRLSCIPVVVLSSSQAASDIQAMYKLNANCFVSKPVELNDFMSVVLSIQDFWFSIVKLPNMSG